ncbi:MAG TPA: lipid II flippase MurJ, partial [Erysipelothrix sp.]
YYFAKKKGDYHYRFKINLKDDYLKPMLIMAVPIILGASINQVNTVIDRRLATSISEGAVATLNYGSKISDSVYALFVTTITTVMYPALTKQAAKNDFDSLKATVTNIMNTVTLIVIPASIGMMVLSEPIVELFLGRGEFAKDPNALSLTAGVMFFYAIGNIGYGLRDVLVRTFYALQDSVTPVISGVISVVINIALNIILSRRMGVSGLALATSISALFAVLVLYISLYLKVEGMSLRKFLVSSTKIGIASIFMGIAAYYTNGFFVAKGVDYKIGLFAGIGVGVIVYGVIMHFMKVEEFDELIDMVRDRIRKKRHA